MGAPLAGLATAEGHGLVLAERLVLGGGVAVYLLGTSVTHGAAGALSRRDVVRRGRPVLGVLAVAVLGPTPLVLTVLVTGVVVALELVETPLVPAGPMPGPTDWVTLAGDRGHRCSRPGDGRTNRRTQGLCPPRPFLGRWTSGSTWPTSER